MRDGLLHEQGRFQARLVLVAHHDQGGHLQGLQPGLKLEYSASLELNAARGKGGAEARVVKELVAEVLPAARVLALERYAVGALRVCLEDRRHPLRLQQPRTLDGRLLPL